jgi:hypothetical protein
VIIKIYQRIFYTRRILRMNTKDKFPFKAGSRRLYALLSAALFCTIFLYACDFPSAPPDEESYVPGQYQSVTIPVYVDSTYEASLTDIYIHNEAELRPIGADFAEVDGNTGTAVGRVVGGVGEVGSLGTNYAASDKAITRGTLGTTAVDGDTTYNVSSFQGAGNQSKYETGLSWNFTYDWK